MTIKNLGGVFGRNPTFNDVTIDGTLTFDGDIDINSDLKVDGDIETTGNVIIATSGKGIDFSATAGTGTSELLDDYEEGTWTPNFAVNGFSGSPTVSASSGTYTKVGRVVTVTWVVTLSTAAYMSDYSQINNLPFASTVTATCGSYGTASIGANTIGSFGLASASNLYLFDSISTNTATSWNGYHTYQA
tara:strand:- start:77 stop:643 length:567 start_codon:yes stop_codon:yes gene_type:complete